MSTFFQDVKFGARLFVRSPALTASIVLLLAVGIGANSAMFALVDSLLIHPVRYQDPDSLAFVWSHDPQGALSGVSGADFMDIRARASNVRSLAAWIPENVVVTGADRPRQVGAGHVTANYFETLGVKPVLGRAFLPDEDGLENPANAAHTALISYAFWQSELGGEPNVLGRTLRLNSVPYKIVGVVPAGFQFWWKKLDIWTPASIDVHERDYHNLVVIGRVTGSQARAASELNGIALSLGEAYPKSDRGWTLRLEPLKERLFSKTFRQRLMLLTGAVGLVLLLACANIAGLLLARGAARQAEIAVRVSLGASTGRLVQQLFTESALLAVSGGALGLTLAWALIRFAPQFIPPSAVPSGALDLSMSAIWFTLGASLLTCVLVGLAPALGLARPTQQTLRQSGRGNTAGRGSQRVRQTIVATEVAAALILFAGAWLMATSLRNLARTNPGFDPAHVFTVRLFLPASKYNVQQTLRFCRQGQERMAALPGVESVAVATTLPLLNNFEVRFDRDGSPRPEAEQPSAPYAAVGPEYFATLHIPLLRGRYFAASDDERAPLVAVISKELAAKFFPNEDPLGKKLEISRPVPLQNREETVHSEIVGVVDNVKDTDLTGDPRPMVYAPYAQNPFLRGVWFVARVAGAPTSIAAAVRHELQGIDPEQPVEQFGTLEDTVAGQLAQPRFQTSLMSGFAAVSLLLAMLGVYGVNAYTVTRRRNELGLRMALGATRGQVLAMVIRQGMIPTGIGILLGIAGAVAGASVLRSILVGADSIDFLAFLGAALVLAIVSLIACAIPALRATQIDPAITLRAE